MHMIRRPHTKRSTKRMAGERVMDTLGVNSVIIEEPLSVGAIKDTTQYLLFLPNGTFVARRLSQMVNMIRQWKSFERCFSMIPPKV